MNETNYKYDDNCKNIKLRVSAIPTYYYISYKLKYHCPGKMSIAKKIN